MKKSVTWLVAVVVSAMMLSGCATIAGGSRYYAHVEVKDKPNAKIIYNGQERGTGKATFLVKRKDANRLAITVKEEGCSAQIVNYTSRTFRGWSFVGTLVTWTGVTTSGLYLPFGLGVDLITGALWKPNTAEPGIFKEDYKNFRYVVEYNACGTPGSENTKPLVDVLFLKNGSIIRGMIIEQIPNVQVKIQTNDDNLFVFKTEEIEKIVREPQR